jgi:large subunit ribosomal protein L13
MNDSQKTFSPSGKDIDRQWFIVDAGDKVLGRLATEIARILRGKHKPVYTPHLDMGDHVVVINAQRVRVTGKKAEQKIYYRHTGYAGGIRSTPFSRMIKEHPERVLKKAVWGMLPHNSLGRQMLKKLKVYAGPEHRHTAQKPQVLDL